jgi:hypothetical protein
MPLYHPAFPTVEVPGAVTVVIVPESDAPNPTPSDATIRTVCAYLNERRLLTTELFVVAPTYNKVEIHAALVAGNQADLGQVQTDAIDAMISYFHPLRGGEDGRGWPFGGAIYFSRVFQRLLQGAGVQRVESVVILLDGVENPICQDVVIPPGVLLYSDTHTIDVSYAFEQSI